MISITIPYKDRTGNSLHHFRFCLYRYLMILHCLYSNLAARSLTPEQTLIRRYF